MKSSRIEEHKNIKENIIKVIFLDLKKINKAIKYRVLREVRNLLEQIIINQ